MEFEHDQRPAARSGESQPTLQTRELERAPYASPEVEANQPCSLVQLAILTQRAPLTVPVEPTVFAGNGEPTRSAVEPSTIQIAQWRAVAGFRIAVHFGHAPVAADLEQQEQVWAYLLALLAGQPWSLQLRLIARPTPADAATLEPTLELVLLCAATGTKHGAARSVRELAAGVALAGTFLAPTYALAPLTERNQLRALLEPFQPLDLVELRRPPLTATTPEPVAAPQLLPRRRSLGQRLCQALISEAVRHEQALLWAVTLEGHDEQTLDRHVIADALARLSDPQQERAETRGTGVQTLQLAVPGWQRERETLVLGQQWLAAGGLRGQVQAFLAAEQVVSPAVIAAGVVDCGDLGLADGVTGPAVGVRAVRPAERRQALAALQSLRVRTWQRDAGARTAPALGADHLQHVGDVPQVAALFWLPIPGPRGLPGHLAPRSARAVWLPSAPTLVPESLTLGENRVHGLRQVIGIGPEDRLRHAYVVGQTGVGKSTLLLTCILQDLWANRGVVVIDPHGDLIQQVLALYPEHRLNDLIVLDPADRGFPLGFNILECADEDEAEQVVENFVGLCRQLFDPNQMGIVGPRFEHAVRNAILTVLSMDGGTLIEVVRVLTDPAFLHQLLPRVKDPMVRRYWTDQIAQTSDFHRSEVLDYIVSKFSRFVHNRQVRNIIGQPRSSFSMRQVMDEGKVLLVSLAQGRLGLQLASFLGLILVPKLLLAAFSRVNLPQSQRHPIYLYVDEFQNYASPSFVDIVSGARKYGLGITMAHQHTAQLPPEVRSAIFGNVGTLVSFRAGLEDAVLLAAGMQPSVFGHEDFIALPNYQAIAQVLDHGMRSPTFTLNTLPGPEIGPEQEAWGALVREEARQRYGRPRAAVEAEIAKRAML